MTEEVLNSYRIAHFAVEEAIERGVLWPFTIPMLIVCGIMILINKLIMRSQSSK